MAVPIGAQHPLRPLAGNLLDLVQRHGFTDARVATETLILRPRGLDRPPISVILDDAARRAVAAGEGTAWRRGVEESAARGVFVFAVTRYAVSARA